MRRICPPELERGRMVHPTMGGLPRGEMFGYFVVQYQARTLHVISSGPSHDWEHVSVNCRDRCPNYEELQYVKELFWGDDETVFHLHPKKTSYVNACATCLHLWKPVGIDIPLPPEEYLT